MKLLLRKDTTRRLIRALRRTSGVKLRVKISLLWNEFKEGANRFTLRVEMLSTDPSTHTQLDSRTMFELQMKESTRCYQTGEFSQSQLSLFEAARVQERVAANSGLSLLNLRLCGSEISGSIGHTAFALGTRAALDILGLSAQKRTMVVSSRVANSHYLDQWSRYFEIQRVNPAIEASLYENLWSIHEHVSYVSTRKGPIHANSAWSITERAREEGRLGPLLELNDEDRERGAAYMRNAGLPKGGWFVALHVRGDQAGSKSSARNALIEDYLPAIEVVTSSGGWVVNLGSGLNSLPNLPHVIDLAKQEHRPPWVDVYVLGASRFMLGTTSGPSVAAMTFGVPVLWTNLTGMEIQPYCSKTIMIPKLARSRVSHRLLTIAGTLSVGFGAFDGAPPPTADGTMEYEWSDNDPQDIERGVLEMLEGQYLVPPTPRQIQLSASLMALGGDGGPRCSDAFLSGN